MPIDQDFIEALLHEDEGASLDFKSAQYPFKNATKQQKAELLKDILAFANSWRRTNAYILIGVEEVQGGRSKPVGVKTHFDDADLHQFVNSMTQRLVEFAYRIVRIDGVEIDVIEIPIQERPVYLKKNYDKLQENEVYIRDGSSTRIATPDEIGKMAIQGVQEATPQFALEWADLEKGSAIASPCILHTLALCPWPPDDTFSLPRPRSSLHYIERPPNPRYSEEVMNYAFERALFAGLGFYLFNKSNVVGRRIRFEGVLGKQEGLWIREWLEDLPRKYTDGILTAHTAINRSAFEPNAEVQEYDDRWEITIDFGDIRPQQKVLTTSPLYFGSVTSATLVLDGQLFGDNLPEPVACSLKIQFEVEQRELTKDDVAPYLDQ